MSNVESLVLDLDSRQISRHDTHRFDVLVQETGFQCTRLTGAVSWILDPAPCVDLLIAPVLQGVHSSCKGVQRAGTGPFAAAAMDLWNYTVCCRTCCTTGRQATHLADASDTASC